MKFRFNFEIEPTALIKVVALIAFILKLLTYPRIQPKVTPASVAFWFI